LHAKLAAYPERISYALPLDATRFLTRTGLVACCSHPSLPTGVIDLDDTHEIIPFIAQRHRYVPICTNPILHISFDVTQLLVRADRSAPLQHGISASVETVEAPPPSDATPYTDRGLENRSTGIKFQHDGPKGQRVLRVTRGDFDIAVPLHVGHLIDRRYSADTSHFCIRNYVPMNARYNTPYKTYLTAACRCSSYIEIPLFTPRPPRVHVEPLRDDVVDDEHTKQHAHAEGTPVPIGIVLIIFWQQQLSAVYYFPNNVDYLQVESALHVRQDYSDHMTSRFRLRPSLHLLFHPARLLDGTTLTESTLHKQLQREREFAALESRDHAAQLLHALTRGAELADLFIDPPPVHTLNAAAALRELRSFLLDYYIRNSLKTEVLQLHQRQWFLRFYARCIRMNPEDVLFMHWPRVWSRTLLEVESTPLDSWSMDEWAAHVDLHYELCTGVMIVCAMDAKVSLMRVDQLVYRLDMQLILIRFAMLDLAGLSSFHFCKLVDLIIDADQYADDLLSLGIRSLVEELDEADEHGVISLHSSSLLFVSNDLAAWMAMCSERLTHVLNNDAHALTLFTPQTRRFIDDGKWLLE